MTTLRADIEATVKELRKEATDRARRARPIKVMYNEGIRDTLIRCADTLERLIGAQKRFWAKVNRGRPDDCWLWTAARGGNGYGLFRIGRIVQPAHRFSWEIHNGPIPEGLFVLHRCDNPLCVNPAHLFLGTQADNMADRNAKGRTSRGEAHGEAKLTEAQVREIRASRESQRAIAKRLGVAQTTISDIRKGKTWKLISQHTQPKESPVNKSTPCSYVVGTHNGAPTECGLPQEDPVHVLNADGSYHGGHAFV